MRTITALGLIGLAGLPASAQTFTIECPAELPPASLHISGAPAGWKGTAVSSLLLHNAAPLEGPPEELGTLMGESVKDTPNLWVTRYPLSGPSPKGKWFSCDYGMLNEVSLNRRLPDGTKECVVTGRKGKRAGENAFNIVCKK